MAWSQLTRYCELLNRDPLLAPVRGIFAAQTITPQARVLAQDRGFDCLILDYDEMKGAEDDSLRLLLAYKKLPVVMQGVFISES